MSTLHNPPQGAVQIYHWFKMGQIDYGVQYLQLYIAYNAWYREVTNTHNDREALALLKKRFVIWDDYKHGRTLHGLRPYFKRLVELSQLTPIPSTRLYWDGEFKDQDDWRSLIEFWYQVRCLIVHSSKYEEKYAWFAYETLSVFMGEIIERMQTCFSESDDKNLQSMQSLADISAMRSSRFKELQQKLYQKYIDSPDIWQVDMTRVKKQT